MSNPLIIYHGGCSDGFAAALAAHMYYGGNCELHGETNRHAYSGESPVKDRVVLILDYSYPKDELASLAEEAKIVIVIDHHKTALEALNDVPVLRDTAPLRATIDGKVVGPKGQKPGKLYAIFDMEQSGAALTWRFLFPNRPLPYLIRYVEDRDLWRFALPRSEEINASLASYEQSIPIWHSLLEVMETAKGTSEVAEAGKAILRAHQRALRSILKTGLLTMVIGDKPIPVVNANYHYASDLGDILARQSEHGYAAVYSDTPKGRAFSLRSRGFDAPDVSEIAKRHGGGGHRNAAGFLAPHGWTGEYDA